VSFKKTKILFVVTILLISSGFWFADHSLPVSDKNRELPAVEADAKNSAPVINAIAEARVMSNDEVSSEAWQMTNAIDDAELIPDNAIANTVQSIALAPHLIDQSELTFTLPNGQVLTMQRHHVETFTTGAQSWVGRVADQPQLFAVITQNGQALAGTVQTQDASFNLRSLKNGAHIIYQLDTQKINRLTQHNDQRLPPLKQAMEANAEVANVAPSAAAVTDAATSEVKVLFVYTQAAIADRGLDNLIVEIENEVALTNAITYVNSDVHVQLIPAAHITYDHAEANTFNGMLDDLTNNTYLNIEALRDQYAADLVQGIVARGDYCGLGWLAASANSVDARYGYSIISQGCISNTLAHELGHNMGLDHDVTNTQSTGVNHGYRVCQPNGFHTVMAYPCLYGDVDIDVPWIRNFSNPDVMYNGLPTGVEGSSDNAHVLENNTRFKVAGFRSDADDISTAVTAPVTTPPQAQSTSSNNAGALSWQMMLGLLMIVVARRRGVIPHEC
jgi:hypothetical protein